VLVEPYIYDLPPHLIAQRPVHPYDAARLLVVMRGPGQLQDSCFTRIGDFLTAGDLLVFNSSRVMPARLFGTLEQSGAKIEVLLLRELSLGHWECLARPMKRLKVGKELRFSASLQARVQAPAAEGRICLEFFTAPHSPATSAEIEAQACMPIPPYIRDGRADQQDRQDYQAHFARQNQQLPGASVAAPTAGLHFTPELRAALTQQGVRSSQLTLHVGAASFQPLLRKGGTLTAPGEERYLVEPELVAAITECRKAGGRVIAVGTTVARALESFFAEPTVLGTATSTSLCISPGHVFRGVDCLITNFHQPNTTHLLLVEALLGRELLARAYAHAVREQYRFLSYGDGMLIC
jgi:S-adenosylmethionine:tRNA ribosyltransferase-isomerase